MADELVVGIDFGTLSGRVVVVRVSDGAELGTAVHEYAHAVMEDSLTAGDGRRLPRPGRCRIPTTTARCFAGPCRRPSGTRASTRAMGRRGETTYLPNPDNAAAYDRLYRAYTRLHDWLGREHRDLMHDLKALARGE